MKWVWGTILVIAFILIGGLREIIFVNINEQIEFTSGRKDANYVLPYLQFLGDYTIAQLNSTKWLLTVVTMVVNFILSVFSLRLVMDKPKAVRWLIMMYLAGFVVAGLSFGLGKILSQDLLGYTVARAVMGGLQSPFPLMLLIPALFLITPLASSASK